MAKVSVQYAAVERSVETVTLTLTASEARGLVRLLGQDDVLSDELLYSARVQLEDAGVSVYPIADALSDAGLL